MFAEFVSSQGLHGLPLAAAVIFFLTFLAVLAHLLLDRNAKRRLDRLARLPFEDGAEPNGSAGGASDGSTGR